MAESSKNAEITVRAETDKFLTAARVVVQQSCKLALRTGMIPWLLQLQSLTWLTVQASFVPKGLVQERLDLLKILPLNTILRFVALALLIPLSYTVTKLTLQ